MKLSIPKLPSPDEIQEEIRRLRSRIGELRALLRLSEQQHIQDLKKETAAQPDG